MRVANQCATKIGSLFVFSKEMFFFFRLDTKEKEPKRKDQGCVFSASSAGVFFGVKKGRLFERSEFLPFSRRKHLRLTLKKRGRETMRRERCGMGTCVGGVGAYCSPFISRYSSMVCAGASFRSTVLSLFRR